MQLTKYKKGECISVMSIAGEDMYILKTCGIEAEIFDTKKGYRIPMLSGGQGNFFAFMKELKILLEDKPIIFFNLMNYRLIKALLKFGFKIETVYYEGEFILNMVLHKKEGGGERK